MQRWHLPAETTPQNGAAGTPAHGSEDTMRIRLQWEESLKIGVAAMDRDHERLVTAMGEIETLNAKKADKTAIGKAIERLAALTVKHFEDEERYMTSIAFPDLSTHKMIHKDLLQKFQAQAKAFQAGDGTVSEEFNNFLVCWLRAHIRGIDAKYAAHRAKVPAKV